MGLLLHCGGEETSLYDLRSIPLPKETDTYKPVGHYDLAVNLAEVATGMLPEYQLHQSQFGLARDGKQMFGVHSFSNGNAEMGLSIGFRNSYDKSMSVGIAIGASVFVCDNLALTGDITVMRKHTSNVWQDVEEMTITTIYRSKSNFHNIEDDARRMKNKDVENDTAYSMLGFLYGRGVFTPRQLPIVKREWLNPSYPQFESRNLWSFYNACTEALKTAPPAQIMERHIKLHDLIPKAIEQHLPSTPVQTVPILNL
jgi:hypothetical protein